MGVVIRRYIDFLILLIPTPLVLALFCSSILALCSFLKCFFVLYAHMIYRGYMMTPTTVHVTTSNVFLQPY